MHNVMLEIGILYDKMFELMSDNVRSYTDQMRLE